jgi:hypothetical protein
MHFFERWDYLKPESNLHVGKAGSYFQSARVIRQKTGKFINTAVKTSNIANTDYNYQVIHNLAVCMR